MKPGLDLLGMAHPLFPFKLITDHVVRDTPIGFFWNTFGPAKERFIKLMDAGFHTFRIQMWWPGESHSIVPMDLLGTMLRDLRETVEGRSINLYVSPSCEHSERNINEVRKRLDLVMTWIPSAVPVNSTYGGVHVPKYLLEKHGSNPGRVDMASTDGTNIYDIDSMAWIKNYCNKEHPAFLWGYRFNLREIPDPGQSPPPIKNRKAAPTKEYFLSIVRQTQPVDPAPTPNFKFTVFKEPNTYKTHAEDDQEPNENTPDEKRENRPVLIIKPNVPVVDILASNGKIVGQLPRYGPFPGELTRYYAGHGKNAINLYGYQIGNQAKKISGSEWVWFKAGNKILGPVHPAFRAGSFRS